MRAQSVNIYVNQSTAVYQPHVSKGRDIECPEKWIKKTFESPNLLDDNAIYPLQWPQANQPRIQFNSPSIPVRLDFESSIPVPT